MEYEASSKINQMSLEQARKAFLFHEARMEKIKETTPYRERIKMTFYNNTVATMDQIAHRIGYLKKTNEK